MTNYAVGEREQAVVKAIRAILQGHESYAGGSHMLKLFAQAFNEEGEHLIEQGIYVRGDMYIDAAIALCKR